MSSIHPLADIHAIIEQEQINILFQPIVSVHEQAIYGYEALSRGPSDSPLHSPTVLFDTARRAGCLAELEKACLRSALRRFRKLNLPGKLFLNVGPELLVAPCYQNGAAIDLLQEFGFTPDQVVLELTEQSPMTDLEQIANTMRRGGNAGLAFALDDLGAGYSSLRAWSELCPAYVKIDRHFISQIDTDTVKREFVRSIIEIARSLNSNIIAEGVETEAEMKVLLKMDVPLLQGYYIDRPKPNPVTDMDLARLSTDSDLNLAHTAEGLVCSEAAVNLDTPVLEIANLFRQRVELASMAVLDGEAPVGIIHRPQLMEILSRPFALDLHINRTAQHVMNTTPLCIEASMRLDQVSRLVTSRARFQTEEDFIITRHGRFLGIGQVIDLLRQITELQIRTARNANPLTMLPGNIPINDCINRLLQNREAFVACYLDLDHFKAYNDIYGYALGDRVLIEMANLLKKRVTGEGDFVGHIGGDDFIIVFRREDWSQTIQDIFEEFAQRLNDFYREEHLAQGGLVTYDREGVERFHPLISISAGAVQIFPGDCTDAGQISSILSQVKLRSKATPGFSLIYQRHGDILQLASLPSSQPAQKSPTRH